MHGVEYHEAGCTLCRRQMQLEQEMRGTGFTRIGNAVAKARAEGHESETPYGNHVMKSVIEPLSIAIKAFLDDALAGNPSRFAKCAVQLGTIHHDAAAYLAIKTVLDNISNLSMVETTVARKIGEAVEEEARLQAYHEQNPALFDTIVRDHVKRGKKVGHTKAVVKGKLRQSGATFEDWTEAQCVHAGMKCVELLYELEVEDRGHLFEREEMPVRDERRHNPTFRIAPTQGLIELIEYRTQLAKLLAPSFMPTLIPPRPWSGPFKGGYWTRHLDARTLRLIKTRNMKYMEELLAVEMPDVFEAINAIQETPWCVNRNVLGVMQQAVEAGLQIVSLAPEEQYPTTPAEVPPVKYKDDEEAYRAWAATPAGARWKAWRANKAAVHERNAKAKSRHIQATLALSTAERFAGDPAFYFPHQLDFRGRVYPMPPFLNPQGPDNARALLQFAEGEAITAPDQAEWLAVQGANCFGMDKVSFAKRVQWVAENEAAILRTAGDPLGYRWWMDADAPWQFLAFCFEWKGFTEQGYGFVSHIPVALDGTCNGLQHFSAMLCDPIGGAAVNLIDADAPQDIYQRVADRTIEILKTKNDETSALWLTWMIDRKLTKRPVMILPYGGTQYACRKYIEDFVRDEIAGGHHNPFGEDIMSPVVYLTSAVWEAIGDTVVAAREAMRWLRKAAGVMAKAQLPISWQTPIGFPVRQAYPEWKSGKIKMSLGKGPRIQRRVVIETGRLDVDEQINGLSPNFVHSLDAAALMGSVLSAKLGGIRSFSMIHDSYGTTAARTSELAATLRLAFVSIYEKHDVLADLRDAIMAALPEAKLPALPRKGTLDVHGVIQSRFFFA